MTSLKLSQETLEKINSSLTTLIELFKETKSESKSSEMSPIVFFDSMKIFDIVRDNDISQLKELIKAGANLNIEDKYGRSPLHYAQSVEQIKILLEAGANINNTDEDGKTCLFLLFDDQLELMKLLINSGADINHQDNYGYTLLHRVNSKPERIRLLLDSGADYTLKNRSGQTPEDVWKCYSDCKDKKIFNNWKKEKELFKSKETFTKEEVKELLINLEEYLLDKESEMESETESENGIESEN